MRIDGLLPDPRRPGSVRVVVGGQPAWTVPADEVARLALVEGGRMPPGAVEVLDAAADEEGALRAALRMLERRSHGRRELGRKLERKGHADGPVERALDRLDRLGLLDDRAFAEGYVAARAGRGSGPARLRRDLGALGVAPDVADGAIATLRRDGGPDPWQRTLAQATRRADAIRALPRVAQVRRLTAFLARRGFVGEEARAAIERLVGPSGAG